MGVPPTFPFKLVFIDWIIYRERRGREREEGGVSCGGREEGRVEGGNGRRREGRMQ